MQAHETTASSYAPVHRKAPCCNVDRTSGGHEVVQSTGAIASCMRVTVRLAACAAVTTSWLWCTRAVPLRVLAFSQCNFHCCTCLLTATAASAAGLVATHQRSKACKSAIASCGRPSMRPSSVSQAASKLSLDSALMVAASNSTSASAWSQPRAECKGGHAWHHPWNTRASLVMKACTWCVVQPRAHAGACIAHEFRVQQIEPVARGVGSKLVLLARN